MAKRGRKPKNKMNISSARGIITSCIGLLLILFGAISLLSIFAGVFDSSAQVTSKLQIFLGTHFGLMAFFVSLITIYLGLLLILNSKPKFLNYRILGAIVVLFVGFSGMLYPISGNFGDVLVGLLDGLISLPGAVFTYFILVLFGFILLTNKGLNHYIEIFTTFIKKIKDKIFGIKLPAGEDDEEAEDSQLELTASEDDENTEDKQTEKKYQINGYANGSEDNVVDIDTTDDEFDDTVNVQKRFEIIAPPTGPVDDEREFLSGAAIGTATIDATNNQIEHQESHEKNLKSAEVDLTPLENKLPFSNKLWEYPSLDLLSNKPNEPGDAGNVNERAKIIEETLESFGVKADIADVNIGPAFTRYDLNLSVGTKANKIQNLSMDLALRIKSPSGSVRVLAPIPGTNLVGIEVPNFKPSTVSLRSVLESSVMKSAKSKLTIALGHDVSGKPIVQDLTKWPHCLVAGSTGSGKSVMLNTIISTILFRCSPQECKFIMIDPKMVEMIAYNDIPHLLTPVVTDVETKAVSALAWAVAEMERRYKVFSNARVKNIEAYNTLSGFQAEPYIVIVIDELADMMQVASSDVEKYIMRLAQKSRAVGIHLILATQRPSVNVLTGTIKANIPTRMAFRVTSNTDSRVILDQSGAEALIGRGDMLFIPPNDSKAVRIQGIWVSDEEITKIVDFVKNSGVAPDYREEIVSQQVSSNKVDGGGGYGDEVDEKTVEALEIIINEGKASASYLQRKLGIGYSRAARLIDIFEESGIIGQARGSKPREVLTYSVDQALNKLKGTEGDSNEN